MNKPRGNFVDNALDLLKTAHKWLTMVDKTGATSYVFEVGEKVKIL